MIRGENLIHAHRMLLHPSAQHVAVVALLKRKLMQINRYATQGVVHNSDDILDILVG